MATTNGLPYPTLSDAPNAPTHIQALAEAVDSRYGLVVANTAALSGVSSPYKGMRVFVDDIDRVATYNGTDWVSASPFAQASGTTTISGTSVAATNIISVAITFPAGRFTVAPNVTVSLAGFVTNTSMVFVKYPSSITTSGCNLHVVNAGAATTSWTNLPLMWHAIQMTSSTASG